MTHRDLIYVEWEDHHGSSEWGGIDGFDEKPLVVCSIGWFFKEDEKGLMLCSSLSGVASGLFSDYRYILKSCIVKRVVLDPKNHPTHLI